MPIIYYYDALAGAGKTHALAKKAHKLACFGRKVLFVQPSKLLINKTVREELEPLKPQYPITVYHGDTIGRSVISSIIRRFEAPQEGGEIVFITHAAFIRVPYFENASRWDLLIDEVLTVDAFDEYVIPETHALITDHLTLIPNGAFYGQLILKERA